MTSSSFQKGQCQSAKSCSLDSCHKQVNKWAVWQSCSNKVSLRDSSQAYLHTADQNLSKYTYFTQLKKPNVLSIQHSQAPFASRVGLYCLMIALKCLSAAQISQNLTLVCSFNILALRGLEDTFPHKQHWGNCSKVWVCSTSRWTITMFLITNDQMRTIQVQFQESKLFNTVFNKKL